MNTKVWVIAKGFGFYYYAYLKDHPSAVRYFQEAHPLLPNSSRIPESLAYGARRAGQWEQSESFFNQAAGGDPVNANSRHFAAGFSYYLSGEMRSGLAAV